MQVNVAGIRRNIKNIACNYTEAQIKVREATSNDPWGPSAMMLSEIADLTYNVVEFPKIMEMIWRRLNDNGKNWRHVKKALILMEYLIKTGVEKCVKQCKENIFAIEALREFAYYEDGKDYGRYVREKANHLVNLLRDNERLRSERSKALKAKERFARFSSGFGYNDEFPVTKANSEIESVRPKTYDEEEMQLKLALDISREEAQQEQLKHRTDDLRLKLALEQSERDFLEQQTKLEKKESPSHLLDLLDISLGAASSSHHTPNLDPWMPLEGRQREISDLWPQNQNQQSDPWQPAVVPSTKINTSDSVMPDSSSRPVPYGWQYRNIDNMRTTDWSPISTVAQPFNENTSAIAYCNPPTSNSSSLQESFSLSNRNTDNYFLNLNSSAGGPNVIQPTNGSVETGSIRNTDLNFPSSSLNPFL